MPQRHSDIRFFFAAAPPFLGSTRTLGHARLQLRRYGPTPIRMHSEREHLRRRNGMNRILIQSVRSGFWIVGVLLLFSLPARAQGDGASLFKAKCAACHGADGKGDTSM